VFDTTKRILELRDNRKMKTNQFAAFTGVSQSYLNQIANGKRRASVDIIERICNACGINLPKFFEGADNPANVKASMLSKDKDDLIDRIDKLKSELDKIEKRIK
jgi:transcriptional regulator with XRE-family HTH domain